MYWFSLEMSDHNHCLFYLMSSLPLDKCIQRLDLDLRELLAPTDRLAQPGHLEVRVGRLARRQRWVQSRQVLRLTQKASGSGKLTRWGPWRWPWWWPWPWPLWWVWSKASECSRLWWCGFEGTEESPRLKILRWTDLFNRCAMRWRRWPILVTWCHLWIKEQLNRKT